jgi:hypothetical protein
MNKMPTDVEEMLHKIRSDIKNIKRSETIYEKPFRDLIASLDARDVLKVGLRQIGSYLPSYGKYYPNVISIHEWLKNAEKLEEFAPLTGFDPYFEESADTGPLIFLRGVGELQYALNSYLKSENDIKVKNLVFSAISAVATAKWLTFWMEDDPESWELFHQPIEAKRDEKSSRRIRKYRSSSRFKEYEKSVWLSVLEDIEQISYSN